MGHGEQSAKLRGDKMEDVIFSGGDARKPGAACPPQPAFAAAAG
jgi:chromosome segregation ATPase